MARRNSLTTVITDVWDKAKHLREAAEEEGRHVCKAWKASI
jgi:hypothetical protein